MAQAAPTCQPVNFEFLGHLDRPSQHIDLRLQEGAYIHAQETLKKFAKGKRVSHDGKGAHLASEHIQPCDWHRRVVAYSASGSRMSLSP